MDLISVIVPIYKVETYLNRCVESIVHQTYKNLEIILVDDGSPDNCPALCDEWAQKDNRIRVIHKSNGGLSDARNAGINIAVGDYIAFVDGDDWISFSYIELLYKAAKEHNADIAACDIKIVSSFEEPVESQKPISVCEYTPEKALQTVIQGKFFRAVAWNKLYKREQIAKYRFPIGKYHEDEFFTYKVIAESTKLVFVDQKLYFYFQREGSIMNTTSPKHLDALEAYVERLAFLKNYYPNLYFVDKANFCCTCVTFYKDFLQVQHTEKKQLLRRIKHFRKKIHFSVSELTNYSVKQILYIIGSRYCIEIMCRALIWRNNNYGTFD